MVFSSYDDDDDDDDDGARVARPGRLTTDYSATNPIPIEGMVQQDNNEIA